jgi:acetolactate synthase-1/2/3 large subunit
MYFYSGRQLDTDIYTAKNRPGLYFTLNRILFPNKERRIRMSIVTGSHLISKSLKMEGVKNIFTLAGDHVLPALDVMSDEGFHIYDTRHEQAAVHMADAWGRLTGKLGVALYTTPGFANAIPGLANALHSESPLLSISGCAELEELGRGAMQEIDQVGMAAPTTKYSRMVTDPKRIPDLIAEAVRIAFDGRRGPVHLTIPVDVQQMEVDEDDVTFYHPAQYRPKQSSAASSIQVKEAVELMRQAERPLIVLGSAGSYSGSGVELEHLIETIKFPLMSEGDARGLVADTHPYSRGFFDSGLNKAARRIAETDLLILMGRKQDLVVGYAMAPVVPKEAKIIQIDPDGSVIGRNRGVDVGIVGDISEVAKQLANEASKYKWSHLEWLDVLKNDQESQARDLQEIALEESPMHAAYVHQIVARHLQDDDILVFDGGDFCHFGRAYYQSNVENSWWYLPTLGMLGQALPTAMAAKIAYPDRRVIMFTGDGAFGFNGLEYDTAVRHNIPIVGIMGNDSAWGIDRQIQLGVFGKPVATDLLPSRYDQIVKALGGHGELVEHPAELPDALERAFKLERPALLNIRIKNAISPRAEAAVNRWKSHTPQPM